MDILRVPNGPDIDLSRLTEVPLSHWDGDLDDHEYRQFTAEGITEEITNG